MLCQQLSLRAVIWKTTAIIQVRVDGDQTRAIVAERVGSGQILDLYFKVFPTTRFIEKNG